MTRNEFVAICSERTIDPAVAIEVAAVRASIPLGGDALRKALDEEF